MTGAQRGCATIPVDDTALQAAGSWQRVSGSDYYLGSVSRSQTPGDTLTLSGAKALRLALVATECPSCGTVQISWNGAPLATMSLAAPSRLTQQIIPLPTLGHLPATLTITVQGTQPVEIDGLAIGTFL